MPIAAKPGGSQGPPVPGARLGRGGVDRRGEQPGAGGHHGQYVRRRGVVAYPQVQGEVWVSSRPVSWVA